jgi:hypothetical protein
MARTKSTGDLLEIELADEHNIWRDYDPAKSGEALANLAGIWSHLDTDKMVEDIRASRREGSHE